MKTCQQQYWRLSIIDINPTSAPTNLHSVIVMVRKEDSIDFSEAMRPEQQHRVLFPDLPQIEDERPAQGLAIRARVYACGENVYRDVLHPNTLPLLVLPLLADYHARIRASVVTRIFVRARTGRAFIKAAIGKGFEHRVMDGCTEEVGSSRRCTAPNDQELRVLSGRALRDGRHWDTYGLDGILDLVFLASSLSLGLGCLLLCVYKWEFYNSGDRDLQGQQL